MNQLNTIKKLSRLEKAKLRKIIKKHRRYLKNNIFSTDEIDKELSCFLGENDFKNSSNFSDYLKDLSIKNFSKKQIQMIDFFKCYEIKNNHYVQEALINNILSSSRHNFKYINYAQFFNHFINKSNKPNSDESKILQNLKKQTSTGFKEYFKKLIENFKSNQNNANSNPRTYFISVFTEKMINTNKIEEKFMNCIKKKEYSRFDIIKYLSLHYARSSYNFLATIRFFLNFFKINIKSLEFKMYCSMKYMYHLHTITAFVKSLRFFLNKNKKLDFNIKNIDDEKKNAFSDGIANSLPILGFSSLLLSNENALIIKEKNVQIDNDKLFYYSAYKCLEWVLIKNESVNDLFNSTSFFDWMKENFYSNVYINYDLESKILKNNTTQQDLIYLLHAFKERSKIFET